MAWSNYCASMAFRNSVPKPAPPISWRPFLPSPVPDLGTVRVRRLVGAFAGGRIVNRRLAQNQLEGGMLWGLGQALLEQSRLDLTQGRWMNADLAEALVATQADVPELQALLLDEDDRSGHPLGIKGLGEIGVVGVAPAIANAVFHATGIRVRDLPITLDKLLG